MSRTLAMIALHPTYWDMYKDGSKIWELRKASHAPKAIDGLVIYATAPISQVVGDVELVSVHTGYVDAIWDMVKDGCGITRRQYDRYYQGHHMATAYRLSNVWEYDKPIHIISPPQGCRYLYHGEYEIITDMVERRLVHKVR